LNKVSVALEEQGVHRSSTQIRERLRRHVFFFDHSTLVVTHAEQKPQTCDNGLAQCGSTDGSRMKAPTVQPHCGVQCLAVTKAGSRCKNKTTKESGKCHLHDKTAVAVVPTPTGNAQKLGDDSGVDSQQEFTVASPSRHKIKHENSKNEDSCAEDSQLKFVVAVPKCKAVAECCRVQRETVDDDQVITGGYKWERWRPLSGPLPVSGSEAVYEFAISDDRNKTREVVYCGKTAGKEGIHGRMSAYRSCGSHLEKKRGLFSEAVNLGFTVYYRWQNTDTDKAREIELILLRTYDYAWNEKDNKHFRDVVLEYKQRACL
jgi:hypothetical protein